ncbi:hypothetical protein ACP4OV_025012 [Aristida adscensionis]
MATKSKLGELVWEHRLQAAAAVAFVAAAAVSISAVGPRLGAVLSFFWPLLVSTGFFLVAVTVLLRISPPPAGADESGKELIDFVAGCRPEHLIPESPSAAAAAAAVEAPPEPEI